MAEHIYEAALLKTTTSTAMAIASIVPATLAAGVRMAEIREIGIFISSGSGPTVGLGYPAALGTGGITTSETVQGSPIDGTGDTKLVTSYVTTQPTAPTSYMRQAYIPATSGSGIIWVWNPGEFILWAGATVNAPVIWQLNANANQYAIYIKVAE